MTHKPSRPTSTHAGQQPASAADDDLNALLDSVIGQDPPRRQRSTAPVPAGRPQVGEPLARVDDDLRAQIRAIAAQVDALSEASATQAEQGRAIHELRQALRQVAIATLREPQAAPPQQPLLNAEVQLPSLQIKLVLAQAANLLHQADKEVTVLANWAMLFAGIAVGATLSLLPALLGPYTTRFWIYLAIAVFALLVSLVFALLTFAARRRVARAHRAMEESTLTRSVPIRS